MSDVISAVPVVTQPGAVYHAPHGPQHGNQYNAPALDVHATERHARRVQWTPQCPLQISTHASQLPVPQPWSINDMHLGTVPNATLETEQTNLPMQSAKQRYLRRPVKLRSRTRPLNVIADSDSSNNDPSADVPRGEVIFMGVVIAVLLAANSVAIGISLANM